MKFHYELQKNRYLLSRTVIGLRVYPALRANNLGCFSFLNASGQHEALGSETKNSWFLTAIARVSTLNSSSLKSSFHRVLWRGPGDTCSCTRLSDCTAAKNSASGTPTSYHTALSASAVCFGRRHSLSFQDCK